jgi:hypothetical protein
MTVEGLEEEILESVLSLESRQNDGAVGRNDEFIPVMGGRRERKKSWEGEGRYASECVPDA